MSKSLAEAFGNQRNQFIIYRAADKVPVDPVTLQNSNAQDASTHMGLANAYGWLAALGEGFGVGIVITEGSQLFAIDLDGCFAGGVLTPTTHAIVQQYRKLGAYIEVSMSGRGVHIIGSYAGPAPPHECKNAAHHFEMYTRARYIALTGNPVGGDELGSVSADCTAAVWATAHEYFRPGPTQADAGNWSTEDDPACTITGTDAERLALALKTRSMAVKFGSGTKATFRQLWEADADALGKAFPGNNGQPYDASSADQALCNHAAYWWGNNCERILTVIQGSALKRDKWERQDYIRGTILKACALPKVWKGRRDSPPPPVPVVPGNPTLPTPTPPPPPALGAIPPADTGADERLDIYLEGGQLDIYAELCEKMLGAGQHVYSRGGGLVRLGRAAELPSVKTVDGITTDVRGVKRAAAQLVPVEATHGWLVRKLMKLAKFHIYTKQGYERADCPSTLVGNITDQKLWPDVAPLIAIATTPFLRPDMSVCDTPGYDAATGIYYQPSATFPPIIEKPSRDDALQALARLRLPFAEFPYATEAGKTVVIAHAMTLVVRPSFDTSPVFMYPAPIQGTGKTLIVRVISILALGNAAAERPWAEKEELRKVLMSILVAGDVAVLLDNVPDGTKIHSAELARFVTSPTYADRILGRSENKTFPNRTTVSITGNNISGVGDMARRALVAELDADAESALGRPFTIKDLPAYILEHRAQLVVDVLTIIRAYHVAGRPNSKRPTESFEQWSQLIRDPLIWLGMVDPIETQETGTDDTLAPLKAAFAAMAEATAGSGHTFTATQLAGIVTAPSFGPNVGTLRAILLEAKCSEPADPVKLGYWLRGFKGRVAGDWKLIQSKTAHGGGACWQLVERKK
jgi:hypothetical protein